MHETQHKLNLLDEHMFPRGRQALEEVVPNALHQVVLLEVCCIQSVTDAFATSIFSLRLDRIRVPIRWLHSSERLR